MGPLQLMRTEMKSGECGERQNTNEGKKYEMNAEFTHGYAKIVPGASERHSLSGRQTKCKIAIEVLNTKQCISVSVSLGVCIHVVLLSLHLFNMKRNALKCQFAFST